MPLDICYQEKRGKLTFWTIMRMVGFSLILNEAALKLFHSMWNLTTWLRQAATADAEQRCDIKNVSGPLLPSKGGTVYLLNHHEPGRILAEPEKS